MYRINKRNDTANNRFATLARMGETVFRTRDAARIWNIWNSNTLDMTLSRYVARKNIYRILKGLYSLKPVDEIDPFVLGVKAIGDFAYVTGETVLFREGIINQAPMEITLVSRQSHRFKVAGKQYRSRQLKDEYLFNDTGIVNINGVYVATTARAVADTLYFNPKKYFDGPVDWKAVRDIATKVGYNISIPKQHANSR